MTRENTIEAMIDFYGMYDFLILGLAGVTVRLISYIRGDVKKVAATATALDKG